MNEENKARWYVIHTYSGYENKVKTNLEKTVENRKLHDKIFDIVVPVEESVEVKDGKKKVTQKKTFPGYVLIKMVMNDDTWYVVRNTRGVTGFVGPGSKPVPLSDAEVKALGIKDRPPVIDLKVNDSIKVVSGPLENFIGIVQEIDPEKRKIKVLVSMFGRETPVEVNFDQVEKV
ncbi:transcription termination/antitermination protein NusG [Caldanaerobius polysaccharolyticus]|uniref:transcription termination/antitermination protein NusG n=1 Tax=Caldanaerobius polysaccharolyticus TaxID=44256 RepID=UPI00047D54DB|nr:transcription termination/antitermination protein NusG [Caldanaerobius polysaccharolyticus]